MAPRSSQVYLLISRYSPNRHLPSGKTAQVVIQFLRARAQVGITSETSCPSAGSGSQRGDGVGVRKRSTASPWTVPKFAKGFFEPRALYSDSQGFSFSFVLKAFQPGLFIVKNASDLLGELLQFFKVVFNLGLAAQVPPSSLVSCVYKNRLSESVGRWRLIVALKLGWYADISFVYYARQRTIYNSRRIQVANS